MFTMRQHRSADSGGERGRARQRARLQVEELEGWQLLASEPLLDPLSIAAGASVHAALDTPTERDVFTVALPQSGSFTARVAPAAGSFLDARLDLLDADNAVLLSSDDTGAGIRDPLVSGAYLPAGTYHLAVTASAGRGGYTLTTHFEAADEPAFVIDAQGTHFLDVGKDPADLLLFDVDGQGPADLIVANAGSGDVSVLLADGNGAFRSQIRIPVGGHPDAVTVVDWNTDGRPDLAALDLAANTVQIVLNAGDGRFLDLPDELRPFRYSLFDGLIARHRTALIRPTDIPIGAHLRARAAAAKADIRDGFGSDGLTFRVRLRPDPDRPGRYLDSLAVEPGSVFPPPIPIVSDPLGDARLGGAPADAVYVDAEGNLLFRAAQRGEPGKFDPAVFVNGPNHLVAGVAVLARGADARLAALEKSGRSLLIYDRLPDDTWRLREQVELPEGTRATRLAAGDLDGDGEADLAVAEPGAGRLFLFLTHTGRLGPRRDFALPPTLSAAEMTLADLSGDGRAELLLVDAFAGVVNVLPNRTQATGDVVLDPVRRYRSGAGAAALVELSSLAAPRRLLAERQPVALLVRDFTGDGRPDVLLANQGSATLDLLEGIAPAGPGPSSLSDARRVAVLPPGFHPGTMTADDFDGDGDRDVAILDPVNGSITVLRNDGSGRFTDPRAFPAGLSPTGLASLPVEGNVALIVTNPFGDLLLLRGNPDGTFQPFTRVTGQVNLAVGDLDGDGRDDVLLCQEATDQLLVAVRQEKFGSFAVTETAGRDAGLNGPRALELADLNGDGWLDRIVANSSANSVVVFLGRPGGGYRAPVQFYTGSNPVGLTVADFTDDGVPDLLVPNFGSNDVSVLVGLVPERNGRPDPDAWTFRPRPRQKLGAVNAGPVQVKLGQADDRSPLDMQVLSSRSQTLALVTGFHDGFFDDSTPRTVQLSADTPAVPTRPAQDGSGQPPRFVPPPVLPVLPPRLPVNAGAPPVSMASFPARDGQTDLAVLRTDGTLALMKLGPGEIYRETTILDVEDLEQPSDLQLVFFDGGLEIYLGDEGEDLPLLVVFEFDSIDLEAPLFGLSLPPFNLDQGPIPVPVSEGERGEPGTGDAPAEAAVAALTLPADAGPTKAGDPAAGAEVTVEGEAEGTNLLALSAGGGTEGDRPTEAEPPPVVPPGDGTVALKPPEELKEPQDEQNNSFGRGESLAQTGEGEGPEPVALNEPAPEHAAEPEQQEEPRDLRRTPLLMSWTVGRWVSGAAVLLAGAFCRAVRRSERPATRRRRQP